MLHPQTSFESSQAYLAAEYGRAPAHDTLPRQAPPLSQDRGVRLEIRGLSKRYGKRQVLQHTELVIEPGEFVAIVGRSGCGKSTLLRLVAGLEAATQGSIRLDGQDVTGLREDTRIMFQDSRLLPWRRVIDNVALGLPRAGHAAAADVLAQVGLGDRQPDWPARLSGGQR